ncbi:hypothetical protein GH714_034676 [Hevea brasiliensis]|uniref:RNase H type-1 domain-containing protein n=1 Tax=Hevea brasiliensis TaxID=3981 RepID=A0A6A6M2Z3_HEVBR|nr:hypothetical protein GH714_034676 [Hevea brasiliensis]
METMVTRDKVEIVQKALGFEGLFTVELTGRGRVADAQFLPVLENNSAAITQITGWFPPMLDRIKCNTDPGCQPGKSRVGWVFCDLHGIFAAAKVKSFMGRMDSLQAEALSFREALSWVKSKGWKNVDFETDSQLLVHSIFSRVQDLSIVGSIIMNCQLLLQEFINCSSQFIRRSTNQTANSLARAAVSMSEEIE